MSANGQYCLNCATGGGLVYQSITRFPPQQITSQSTTTSTALSLLAPSITGSNNVGIVLGQSATANNYATIGFQYIGAGSTTNYLYLGTTASQPLCIANGNVGIGITNPSTALHVTGTLTVLGTTSSIIANNFTVVGANGTLNIIRTSAVSSVGTAINFGLTSGSTTASFNNYGLIMGGAVGTLASYTGFICLDVCHAQNSFYGLTTTSNSSIYADTTQIRFNIVSSNKMIILASGNVGIGITNPSYTLHVVGSIYSTGDITAFSDKRYKENILPLTQSLDNLSQLTGYSYTRSDLNSDKKYIGLIAQEVKEVFPQAVSYDNNQGLYSLNYGCLIAPVIQAIKELKETVDRLQEKVDKLQEKVDRQDAIIQIFLDHFGPQQ